MKYTYRLVLTALIASVLTLAGAPANAVTWVDVRAGNASITGDTCDKTVVRIEGDWDLDYDNEVNVDVYGPNGGWVDGDYWYGESSGYVTVPVKLCKWNRAGTYRVKVKVEGYDENYDSTGTVSASDTFKFVKHAKRNSTVKRDVQYRPAQRVWKYKVPGRLLRAGKGYKGKPVELYVRIDGGWYEVDQMRTRRRGKFGWRFKPNRFTWAYVYQGNRTTQWDSSKNFRTPVRNGRASRSAVGGDPGQFVTRSY